MNNKVQYHIKCGYGDVGKYCLLPGDPARSEIIAGYLDESAHTSSSREYNIYTGILAGQRVSVCSTGIGGPSAAIALEELTECGVHTFIRVGTCGGIDMRVKSGDIVIASGAVRNDGASKEYAPVEYPAVPDYTVLSALDAAAKKLGYTNHVGVVHSKDSFYGQHSPQRMPVSASLINNWEAMKKLHVLCSEMEAAALFTVAAVIGVRCGAVFSTVWNQERKLAGYKEEDCHNHERAILTAIEAIKLLIIADTSN